MVTTINPTGWVTSGSYELGLGGAIPKHQHDWEHSICLLAGSAEFEIYSGVDTGVFKMEIGIHYLMPKNIYHELRSLADNTEMVSMVDGTVNIKRRPLIQARDGGVLMADGTVVYP